MIDFSQVTDILLGASVVEQIADSLGNILWRASAETDEYFWIENKSPNGATATVTFKKNNSSAPTVTLYKSTDQVTWVSMGSTSTNGITATLNDKQKMYFKATVSAWATSSYQNIISVNQLHNVGGNIMSLLYGDDYQNNTSVGSYAFRLLFASDSNLLDASALKLPATTVGSYCYLGMFQNCTMLTKAPVTLPATTLSPFCYSVMFSGCTYLTTTPELPATTLTNNCYPSMFKNCSSLTTAPELPATTLTPTCYSGMFNGCSILNYVKTYAEDISATNCLNNWLDGVANSGDFYNEGGASYTVDSPSGIPQGWTEHKPLANYFYLEDISGSTNTVKIKKDNASAPSVTLYSSTDGTNWTSIGTTSTSDLNIVVPANSKLYLKTTTNTYSGSTYCNYFYTATGNFNIGGNIMSMLYGDNFENQTTFPAGNDYNFTNLFKSNTYLIDASDLLLPVTTLTSACYYGMFSGCTGLTTPPALPATTLGNICYKDMFLDCSSLTTVPELPATTLANECYRGMFRNCTSLTTAPELPATTLVSGCYRQMFASCTSLNRVTTYANDISASRCLSNWVSSVANTGDFYNLGTATYPSGVSGIPSGWTVHTSL